jgi:hypothetical protein
VLDWLPSSGWSVIARASAASVFSPTLSHQRSRPHSRHGGRTGIATYTAPVSDTPQKTSPDARPSLRKQPQTTSTRLSSSEVPKRLPTPRTIDYACIALAVTAAALIVRGVALLGSTSKLTAFLIKSNNDAGSKKKVPYGATQVHNDLHALRQGTLLTGVIIALALVLLLLAFRRVRTASGSRWAMLIVMLFTLLPTYGLPIKGFPVIPQIFGVIVSVGSIAALALVFVFKPSQQYFRDCRDASVPPELRGQPRPSLFGGRRQRAGLAGPGGRAAAARAAAQKPAADTSTDRTPGPSKARAKVRSDADAIANGAELARSRAKASKSRRTTD